MNSLFSSLPQHIAKLLDSLPHYKNIFADQTIVMLPVAGKHIGLLSSSNLYPESGIIVGVWLQAIDKTYDQLSGRVVEHDHGNEQITEIIITEAKSVYAGLPTPIYRNNSYSLYYVPAGTRHGSDTQPSYGRWVSIKMKL